MTPSKLRPKNPPIVEAVVDIDCDMPPGLDLSGMAAAARDTFQDYYPRLQRKLLQKHNIQTKPEAPPSYSVSHELDALQLIGDDGKQLVQVRVGGFSFNRLQPYTTLDDYLPEIERTWRLFLSLTSPVQIRAVRLRYINRIFLPLRDKQVNLQDYLNGVARDIDDSQFSLVGFVQQRELVETASGYLASVFLAGEPVADDRLPVILDIGVAAVEPAECDNWAWVTEKIARLRSLKNGIFEKSLTDKCLSLFET